VNARNNFVEKGADQKKVVKWVQKDYGPLSLFCHEAILKPHLSFWVRCKLILALRVRACTTQKTQRAKLINIAACR